MSEFTVQRSQGVITIYLSANQLGPLSVPLELQNCVSQEAWAERVPAIRRTAVRYSKPLFERAWLLLGIISMIALPVGLIGVIADALKLNENNRDRNTRIDHYAEARAISFGIFVGVFFLFFIPIFVWKFIGHKQVQRLLQTWAKHDRMLSRGAFIPTWHVKTPGVFRDSTILTINTPPGMAPTMFHPAAYLPSYLNDLSHPEAAYAVQHKGDATHDIPRDEKFGLYIYDRHCACVYYQDWHRTKRPRPANEGGILNAVSQAVAPIVTTDVGHTSTPSNFSSPRNTLTSSSGVVVAVGDASTEQPPALLQTNQPPAPTTSMSGLPFDEEAKLVYGVILSLRNMARKLSGRDEQFVNYRTSTYKLHVYETASGYKFVMLSDPAADSLRFVMRQIYLGPFLDYVVRNPLTEMDSRERGVDNEYFRAGVDRMIRGLSFFN
ncbi:hypothetical protein HGRIS_002696 [Hohenbuehelia grisea]|uniref:Trafficking protein particle complex subunit n=1 Tax=Hohenbuehelia grisea TaxID=104357 RepID=A0ABR3JLS3_9AGAR